MPDNGVLDCDGCGDGDRGLQACIPGTTTPAWTGAFFSVSTSYGAFGYGTQILQGGHAERWFAPFQHPIFGWHMNTRINTNPSSGHEVRFREGTKVLATLAFPSSGAINIYDAGGVLRGTIPAGTWPFQAWAYIEVELNVVESDGWIKIWLFGNNSDTPDIFVDDIDTIPAGGTGVCDNVQWHGVDGNTHWIDDWYLMNGIFFAQGLGGVVIDVEDLDADDLAEWTPAGGSGDNADRVKERPFSGSQSVSTSTDGAKDRYTMVPTENDAEVHAVRLIAQIRKTDVAIAKMRLTLTDAGTQGNGATQTLLTTSLVVADVFKARPSDGDNWDEASVDAMLPGPERISA